MRLAQLSLRNSISILLQAEAEQRWLVLGSELEQRLHIGSGTGRRTCRVGMMVFPGCGLQMVAHWAKTLAIVLRNSAAISQVHHRFSPILKTELE